MSNSVFNSIEELSAYFGTEIKLPKNIPEDCNVVSFQVSFEGGVEFFHAHKENEQGFFTLGWGGEWEKSDESLECELEFDKYLSRNRYVYLRLATKDNSDVFTPKRLLGVKTNHGYIQDVGILYVTTTGYHYCTLDTLKFYISDNSNETVSFEEYVKMFYKGSVYEE